MHNYIKSIEDLPKDSIDAVVKVLERYENSFEKKEIFKECYDRQLGYLSQGKKVPYNMEEVKKAFKAKNFFRDLQECGSYVNFRYYKQHEALKLHTANFCKRDKLCAPCAVRRSYKQQLKFMSIIEENQELLDNDWYYIVIPVKHNKTESYETVMNRVNNLRKKITKSMRNSRARGDNSFWSVFNGGMYSQEVTRSANGWNVHLNFIVNATKLYSTGVSCGEYQHTKTPSKIDRVPLKQVKNRFGQISHQNEELRSFLMRACDSQMHDINKIESDKLRDEIVEVLKYSLKFSSLTNQQLFEVFVKSQGVRLFGTFGNLWGKGLETVTFEGDEVLSGEFEELIFIRTFGDLSHYRLYKREMKQNEEDKILLEHTFGLCLKNLHQYNKDPMIMIPQGNGKIHVKYKGRKDA